MAFLEPDLQMICFTYNSNVFKCYFFAGTGVSKIDALKENVLSGVLSVHSFMLECLSLKADLSLMFYSRSFPCLCRCWSLKIRQAGCCRQIISCGIRCLAYNHLSLFQIYLFYSRSFPLSLQVLVFKDAAEYCQCTILCWNACPQS
jgi:hypothetical protein